MLLSVSPCQETYTLYKIRFLEVILGLPCFVPYQCCITVVYITRIFNSIYLCRGTCRYVMSIRNDKGVIVAYFTTLFQNLSQANAMTVENLRCIVILPISFEPGTHVIEVTCVTAASNSSVAPGVITHTDHLR